MADFHQHLKASASCIEYKSSLILENNCQCAGFVKASIAFDIGSEAQFFAHDQSRPRATSRWQAYRRRSRI
jgi:hypothetical protein